MNRVILFTFVLAITFIPYSHGQCQRSDTTITDGSGYSRINLPEHIQVYESYYTYDGLSMVAEIGGYVGLFLGISVNQIGLLFEKLFLHYE